MNQEEVAEPEEFIKQTCFESTAFLPIYYYIKKSGMDRAKTLEMLESVVSRSPTRAKLIERLTSVKTQKLSITDGNTEAAIKKRQYADSLRNNKVNTTISGKELEYCLQATRGLPAEEIKTHSKYLRELLRNWFNKHYASAKGALADNLRRTICWVDEALNMGDCK